jgi:hypothetical protein
MYELHGRLGGAHSGAIAASLMSPVVVVLKAQPAAVDILCNSEATPGSSTIEI